MLVDLDWLISVFNLPIVCSLIVVLVGFWLTYWYNKQNKKREASLIVADVLAEWVNLGGKKLSSEDILPLHKAYWKAALSLDSELLIELNKRLVNEENAPDAREILKYARIKLNGRSRPGIREILQYALNGHSKSEILAKDFVYWEPTKKDPEKNEV
jgi:hypothetical protein